MKHKPLFILAAFFMLTTAPAISAAETADDDNAELAGEISNLKEKVIDMNRDLFILQEELLFPARTQVAVFLSVDSGAFFKLDSVELRLDDKAVTHYLYTDHQREALARGGIQRLWTGNIKSGEHELVAFFKGLNQDGRPLERAAAIEFAKDDDTPAMLELKIIDADSDMRAHFSIEQWQD